MPTLRDIADALKELQAAHGQAIAAYAVHDDQDHPDCTKASNRVTTAFETFSRIMDELESYAGPVRLSSEERAKRVVKKFSGALAADKLDPTASMDEKVQWLEREITLAVDEAVDAATYKPGPWAAGGHAKTLNLVDTRGGMRKTLIYNVGNTVKADFSAIEDSIAREQMLMAERRERRCVIAALESVGVAATEDTIRTVVNAVQAEANKPEVA